MSIEKPEKGILIGDVLLTPVQKWFFERNLANIHHFNQAALFEIKETITLQMAQAIFNVIAQYHDVFRMRYQFENGQYSQKYSDDASINVEEKTLNSKNKEKLSEEIYNGATEVQSSLNIFDGPIVRVVLYRCQGEKDRLLIVAHHLVIDGVSWRILIDDLETIYAAFMMTGRIALPAKTYSYRQWGNALEKYSTSDEGKKETAYWHEIEKFIKETFLPPDSDDAENSKEDSLLISLTQEETKKLIHNVPQKYDTQINDILLTALTLAAGDTSDSYEFSFTLEGHGREDVIGLDVSRTIGWFTSIFPVFLKITDSNNLEKSISEVKKSLREIPNKGIGYGILKYYQKEFSQPLPKIGFNYLGRLDAGISSEKIFQYAEESSGEDSARENESYHFIDMNGSVRGGIFGMWFAYKKNVYKEKTMEKFASKFKERLIEIIK
jgi:non-ribosomal peptide synthase protein (TIGR01720 family)